MRRCVEIIIAINESIIDDKDNLDEDELLDELTKIRAEMLPRDQLIVQRLFHSIGYVEPKIIEIDEADPGNPANHWAG